MRSAGARNYGENWEVDNPPKVDNPYLSVHSGLSKVDKPSTNDGQLNIPNNISALKARIHIV